MPLFRNKREEKGSVFTINTITGYETRTARKKVVQPSYSRLFAFVYILNLIVGVGAIAMPKAFAMAGWLLGLVLLIVLALLSYMTSTYVIEAMATANAYSLMKKKEKERAYSYADEGRVPESSFLNTRRETIEDAEGLSIVASLSTEETSPLLFTNQSLEEHNSDPYRLKTRYEMGDMANMFFKPIARIFYYFAIVVYLYGDMAIYIVTVPKSLANITCVYPSVPSLNLTLTNRSNGTSLPTGLCYGKLPFMDLYRLYIVLFILLLGPLLFFDLSRSKWLQLLTAILRNIAFLMMIIIAFIHIGMGKIATPPIANFQFVPNLFGVIIYAFMCQHSIPGMVTPLNKKKGVNILLFVDYFSILCYYATLAFSAVFRFNAADMEDVYTLNFRNTFPNSQIASEFIYYFLALFPVFTLSTNFPIIGITLRENLKSLWSQISAKTHWAIEIFLFPLLAIVPPLIIALFTMDVELLVGITGTYAGVSVQYIIPVALVFASRRVISRERGEYNNTHKSPFSHWIILLLILIWAGLCIVLMTIDRLDSYFHFMTPSGRNDSNNTNFN